MVVRCAQVERSAYRPEFGDQACLSPPVRPVRTLLFPLQEHHKMLCQVCFFWPESHKMCE